MIITNTWSVSTLTEMNQTANKWRVLLDLNTVLDVLMRREPYFDDAARVWALAESDQIDGHVAGHSFTTLYYLYRRQENPSRAYWAIRQMLQVFSVADITRHVLEEAMMPGWADFEDAVQTSAARNSGCNFIVTRNTQDYQDQPVTALEPADFLAIWSSHREI